MVCPSRPYHFKFFKDCLPQILFGQFLNPCTIYLGKLDKILKYLKLVRYYGYC